MRRARRASRTAPHASWCAAPAVKKRCSDASKLTSCSRTDAKGRLSQTSPSMGESRMSARARPENSEE
jgi:hypothetical protein